MKFKYNFLTSTLSRLNGEYTQQITENNHFRTNGSDSWSLGKQEQITFTPFFYSCQVYYRKGKVAYRKNLDLPLNSELSFEFTEKDQVNHE